MFFFTYNPHKERERGFTSGDRYFPNMFLSIRLELYVSTNNFFAREYFPNLVYREG